MIILTEDNENMSTSALLKRCLKIRFTGSNMGPKSVLKNERNDKYIIFIDAVPDSDSIRNIGLTYEKLAIRLGIQDTVYIFPIPCIEYIVIRYLARLNVDLGILGTWKEVLLQCILMRRPIINPLPSNLYVGSFKTFEKQCKVFLNNIDSRFSNVNLEKVDDSYLKSSYYLNDSDNYMLVDKCMGIAFELPVSLILSCINPIDYNMVLFDEIELRRRNKLYIKSYYKWLKEDNSILLPDDWWLDKNVDSVLQMLRDTR